MKLRVLLLMLALMVVSAGVVLADICPICGRVTPEGEKYCEIHKAALIAERNFALQEKDLVDEVGRARKQYGESLEALKRFYEDRGDAIRKQRVEQELKDLTTARVSDYRNWEDTITLLAPEKDIPEANKLYEEAEKLRKAIFALDRGRKLREAVAKYRKILEEYPDSNLVDEAAYRLGSIYESFYFGEHRRAAKLYEKCFAWNPDTELPARYMAAALYDRKLHDYENAARLYWLASKHTRRKNLRYQARSELQRLQQAGFGKGLEEEKKEEGN